MVREWLKGLGWRVPVALVATYIFFDSGPTAASAAIKTLPPFFMSEHSHRIRGLLAARAKLVDMRKEVANQLRGLLKVFGHVIGAGGGDEFDARAARSPPATPR